MASASAIASIVAVLVFHPFISAADILSPLSEEMCKKVECGKGTCRPSNGSLSYDCECDPGWKRTPSNDIDDDLKFLPCIIPNCTMDFNCGAAPSPVQDKISILNTSIFDPCFWANCGGGSCNKMSPFAYSCECSQGYYNLLNVSALPCFKECSIGMDCENLGISLSNKSSSSAPPVLNQNGSSNLPQSFHWLVILIIYLGVIQCKWI